MSGKVSLHEAVKHLTVHSDVEVIDVPVEGHKICLLRSPIMPEYAFVMWTIHSTGTASRIKLFSPTGSYSVVCACCPSECYGVTSPTCEEPGQWKWKQEMAMKFKISLLTVCVNHGIKMLFMRNATSWNQKYGKMPNLAFCEAADHIEALAEDYGRKHIRKAYNFINYRFSPGMHPDFEGRRYPKN